jgi:hypothetical protein
MRDSVKGGLPDVRCEREKVERSNALAESVEPEEVLVKGTIEPSQTKRP